MNRLYNGVLKTLSMLGIAALVVAMPARAGDNMPFRADAETVGIDTCIGCHEDQNEKLVAEFAATTHGQLARIAHGCESCHGPGSLHAEEGDPELILSFAHGKKGTETVCLSCHAKDAMDWEYGEHALADVACTDCHAIHQPRAQVDGDIAPRISGERVARRHNLKDRDPELCFKCHATVAAKMNLMSHHPVKEGKMTCASCHDPHGGNTDAMLKTDGRDINDLCLSCHAQYQGPFVFEHEAVVESCTICHTAHGSVVDNLLVKTEPFLCYQCHPVHTAIRVHQDVQAAAGAKCSYCHPQVHGSNMAPHLGAR